jgi:hypothetical protein
MKTTFLVMVLMVNLVGALVLARLAHAAPAPKVEICHFPPGNPAQYETTTVHPAALPQHLAHGDFAGPCANNCNLFSSVCDDQNACTTDICNADGTCRHDTVNCSDGNVCTTDSCVPSSGCVYEPATGACDDGDNCTDADACADGLCVGTPKDCDDTDACTADSCDSNGACEHAPESCPTGESCDPGTGECTPDILRCPCWLSRTVEALANQIMSLPTCPNPTIDEAGHVCRILRDDCSPGSDVISTSNATFAQAICFSNLVGEHVVLSIDDDEQLICYDECLAVVSLVYGNP